MKIKINEKLMGNFKNILYKFNYKKKCTNKVNENSNTRKGALLDDENNEQIKMKRNFIKVFVSMILLLVLTLSLNNKNLNVEKAEIEPLIDTSVAVSSTVDSTQGNNNIESVKGNLVVEEKLVFIPPVENGKVQKMHSSDKVIYSKTLQKWITHDGVDVSGNIGQNVLAIEKGVVTDVYDDSFFGKTIKIEHIKGYDSVYSNLAEDVYVNVGQSVIRGQKIGKIGNTTTGEFSDDPHIHFMLYFWDNSVNPTYIIE